MLTRAPTPPDRPKRFRRTRQFVADGRAGWRGVPEDLLTEPAVSRAAREFKSRYHTLPAVAWFAACEIVAAGVVVLVANGHSGKAQALITVLVLSAFAFVAVGSAFVVLLIRAPVHQRNEVRDVLLVEREHKTNALQAARLDVTVAEHNVETARRRTKASELESALAKLALKAEKELLPVIDAIPYGLPPGEANQATDDAVDGLMSFIGKAAALLDRHGETELAEQVRLGPEEDLSGRDQIQEALELRIDLLATLQVDP